MGITKSTNDANAFTKSNRYECQFPFIVQTSKYDLVFFDFIEIILNISQNFFPTGRNLDPRNYLPRTSYIQLNSNAVTIRGAMHPSGAQLGTTMERQGGPLLDHEALASILVMLFIDDPNISTLRLYRVIKNLCFHVPTRKWIIRALLSIIEKCSDELNSGVKLALEGSEASKPEWLNIRLDSALSCRTNVFVMKRPTAAGGVIKKHDSPITVHSKASPIVCRHTVDLLIFLAKSFPAHFLPLKKSDSQSSSGASTSTSISGSQAIPTLATASTNVAAKSKSKTSTSTSSSSSSGIASLKKDEQPSTSSSGPTPGTSSSDKPTEFWDILSTLDAKINQQRKATSKQVARPVKEFNEPDIPSFEGSPFAQLIKILANETVKNSSQLTDKVLRLLSLISVALPESKDKTGASARNKPSLNYQVKQLFDDNNQTEAEFHLRVIVQVLTSKACSEDGLEDATALLLNLSKCSNKTRYVIHYLLLNGAYSVSRMVLKHIDDLMQELKQLKNKRTDVLMDVQKPVEIMPVDEEMEIASTSNASTSETGKPTNVRGGVLQDRFTKEKVIIQAPNKVKATCDLQLPSMAPLISKTSSQAFFLRILKVITQIRDSVYQTMKNETNSNTKTIEPNQLELSPLSETLKLDTLWDTLSECLKELEETSDHHAVLVLQPTVEAFFLVHASSQNKNACALLRENENKPETEQSNQEGASTSDTQVPTDPTTAQRLLPSIPSESPPDLISPVPDSDTATTSTSSEINVSRTTTDDAPSAMESTPSEAIPNTVTATISGQTPAVMPMPEASGTVQQQGQTPSFNGK